MSQERTEGIRVQDGFVSLDQVRSGLYDVDIMDTRPYAQFDEHLSSIAFGHPEEPENDPRYNTSEEFFQAVSALSVDQILEHLGIDVSNDD